MFKSLATTAAVSLALLAAAPASAAYKIYSPDVTKGKLKAEAWGSYSWDESASKDGKMKDKWELSYGITDRLAVAGYMITGRKNEDDSYDLDAYEFATKYHFLDAETHWLDAGLYLAYEQAVQSNEASVVEAKLMLEKSHATAFGELEHKVNLVIEREVGEHAGDENEYKLYWGTYYEPAEHWEVGVETYLDFGNFDGDWNDQSHLIGPVVEWEPVDHVEIEIGYLAGISDYAPDHVFKWIVEVAF